MKKILRLCLGLALAAQGVGAASAQGFWDLPDAFRHGMKGSPQKATQFANLAGYDSPLPNMTYDADGYVTGWSYDSDNITIITRDDLHRISTVEVLSAIGDNKLTFRYGDHGKYIPVEMLFDHEYSGVMMPYTRWFPEFIKDLVAIEANSELGTGEKSVTVTFDDQGQAIIDATMPQRVTYPSDSNYPLFDNAPDSGECNTFNIDPETGRLRSKIYGTEPNDTVYAWQALVYDAEQPDDRVMRSLTFGDPADYAYYVWDLTYDTDGRIIASTSEEPSRNYSVVYTLDEAGNWTTANLQFDGYENPIEREITYYAGSEGVDHWGQTDLARHNLKGDVKSCSLLGDFTDMTYMSFAAKDVEYDKAGYVRSFNYGKHNAITVSRDASHRITRVASVKDDDGSASRIDIEYGQHGKYIPTESLFYEYNVRSCTGYLAPWYPALLPDVQSIKLTMANGENRTDELVFTDDDHTRATLTGIGDHQYTFEGDYVRTDLSKYDGFNSNLYTYDVAPSTGKLVSRRIGYTDDPATDIKQTFYNQDVANSPDSCASKSRANTWKMLYNEHGDPVSFTSKYEPNSWTATYEYDDHGNWVKMYRISAAGEPLDTIARQITYWADQPDDSYWSGPDKVRHGLQGPVKTVGVMLDYWDPSLHATLKNLEYDEDGYLTCFQVGLDDRMSTLEVERDSLHRITRVTRDTQGSVKFTYAKHGKYIPLRQMLYRATWYVNVGYNPYWWPQFMRDLSQVQVLPLSGDNQTYNITVAPDGSYARVEGDATHQITFKDKYGVTDLGKYGEFNPNYFNYEVIPQTGKLLRSYVGIPGDTEYAEDFWYYDDAANSLMGRFNSQPFDNWRYMYQDDESSVPLELMCQDDAYSWTATYQFDHHDNWISCTLTKGDTEWRHYDRPITYWGEEQSLPSLAVAKARFHYDGSSITATGLDTAAATLVALDGRVALTLPAWSGEAIDVTALAPGTYVLRAGSYAFKFAKK